MRSLLLFLSLTRLVGATITPICSLSEVECIEQGALVVFDIDDTLIRYPSHLGSECWFVEACSQPNFQEDAALLAEKLCVVSVEPNIPAFIAALQERGIAVMGMTNRALTHPRLPDWPRKTVDQVKSIGVRFSTAPLISNPPPGTAYLDGILIIGSMNKGVALVEFIRAWGQTPTQTILFDDRLSDLQNVQATDLPCRCYWYRAIEPSRAAYDSKAAARELKQLKG